ncbi:MAG TPA: hypothetical protein VMD05_06090 [Candidatus Nanoarchaeia archaeon]|nr:hypothetical protein [Candidatus Nanoarchaeia archaeon]
MDEKISQEASANTLCKCPHCTCCFCNEEDLKKHLEAFGTSPTGHQQEFQKVHGRLEHGSFGGPE